MKFNAFLCFAAALSAVVARPRPLDHPRGVRDADAADCTEEMASLGTTVYVHDSNLEQSKSTMITVFLNVHAKFIVFAYFSSVAKVNV